MLHLIELINQLKGQQSLLARSPAIKRSLDLRNPYTDPLHFLQIELMSRVRSLESLDNTEHPKVHHEKIDKALLVTIAGIAASMRNTG